MSFTGPATTPAGTPAPHPVASKIPVRQIRPRLYRSRDGRWAFEHEDGAGTLWLATYLPTRQHAPFSSLDQARRAAASGELLDRFHAEDLAVLARPCPGGCGEPAAALVDTTDGPAPVCARHRPVIEGRGYSTRVP